MPELVARTAHEAGHSTDSSFDGDVTPDVPPARRGGRPRSLRASLQAGLVILAAVALGTGCGDSTERRIIDVTQADDGCLPLTIDVQAGEAITFRIKNEGGKDHEFEGIDGTRVEELLVPAGRTRSMNYTVPSNAELQKVKCYIPAGSSTVIELRVAGATGSAGPAPSDTDGISAKKADTTVGLDLQDYVIRSDRESVRAGTIRFNARNVSPVEVHEVAVLRPKPDGSFENLGEIEDVAPGGSGEIVLELRRGTYVLACLIVPGQAGSTVDHYAEGMKTEFLVE